MVKRNGIPVGKMEPFIGDLEKSTFLETLLQRYVYIRSFTTKTCDARVNDVREKRNSGDVVWGNFAEINVWKMCVHPNCWKLNDFGFW